MTCSSRKHLSRAPAVVGVVSLVMALFGVPPVRAATAAPKLSQHSAVTHKVAVRSADGLDRAQLAELGRTGRRPADIAAVKPPSEGAPRWTTVTGASRAPGTAVGARTADGQLAYPGMTVNPGTPTVTIDSATYAGGNFPADIYQYMTTADCQAQKPTGGVYTKNRYSSCMVQQYEFDLFNCDAEGLHCTPAGAVTWRATVVGRGNDDDLTNFDGGPANGTRMVKFQVTVDEVTMSGSGPSATMGLGMSCSTTVPAYGCNGGGSGPTKTFADWDVPDSNTLDYRFTSPIADGAGGDHLVVAAASLTATESWAGQSEQTTPYSPVPFRFDSAGRNPAWASKFQGYEDAAVFATVPILQYDGQCGTQQCNDISESADHIELAYNYPQGTMPPWRGGGLKPAIPGGTRTTTDWLSRTTDGDRNNPPSGRIGANATVATKVCNAVLPIIPTGTNCDEFPFATTYQGAAGGGPYSLLRIAAGDNQEAGRRLGPFYTLQRLVDCDPFTGADGCDAFGVIAVGPMAPQPYAYIIINEVAGGQFADEWDAMGDAAGVLGAPAGPESAITGGQEQDFAGGKVYWSPGTGTREVHGAILTDYLSLGGTADASLGFPLSDQQATPDGGAQENLFPGSSCGSSSGAAIITSSSTPASEMQGCLYQAYLTTYNGPGGTLGYPTTNERPTGSGKVNYMSGTSCDTATGSALYWNGAAHAVTGCIFQQYKAAGEAAGSLGFPTGEAFPIAGGSEQVFQHGYITSVNGVTSTQPWLVGHAAHAGNDYPYETIGQFDHQNQGADAWEEYYGQCDSFAAWKVYENLAGTPSQPPIVPDPNWIPSAAPGVSPVNQTTWGNADNWGNMAPTFHYTVDDVPSPGAIIWWRNATADPQNASLIPDPAHGMGGFGHVGYVTDVYPDGSITIEQYNLRLNGEYSTLHMPYGQSVVDTSFNQGSFTVPWPAGFVHIADGPSGLASPAEPVNGTVSWSYPARGSQLKVIGPGSPSGQFSTANVWYSHGGHGETGAEMYTHTNGAAALSTATWTPSGLSPNSCYRIDAFVPDNYSDNPVAVYTVTDSGGTSFAAVNENALTDDWSELGVYKTDAAGAGLSVKVDDRGTTGLYVAADAMRFWWQPDCSVQGDTSPIMMPSSYYPSASWSLRSGHGFFGSEHYTTTTGTGSPTKTATWSPAHLLPHSCYDVSLYVPDNYSDNPAATYNTTDAYYGGDFWPTVDENVFTNQFAGIGTLESGSGGYLPVSLQNSGPSGEYVAADAAAFVLNPDCVAQNGGTSTFGQPTGGPIIGPGSPTANFSTTGNWRSYLGFGWNNHQLYSPDNAGATVTWTFYGTPGACYTVDAYIPIMGYANNTSAVYDVSNGVGGVSGPVNQNTTGGWTNISRLNAGNNGKITAKLTDAGNSGAYTGADAMRFTAC